MPTRAFTVRCDLVDPPTPDVPAGLDATAGDEQVSLNWTDNDPLWLLRYDYRVDGGAAVSTGLLSAAVVTGLTNDQEYDFEVRSVNAAGVASAWSSVVSETPTGEGGGGGDTLDFDGWELPADGDYVDVDAIATANAAVGARVVFVADDGNDSNDGLSSGAPKLTIAAGMALMRNGMGDILRLKAGDTWTNQSIGHWKINGASAANPSMICAYGTGARPIIMPGDGITAIRISGGGGSPNSISHLIISGIRLYAHTRDPDAPGFVAANSGTGIDCALSGDNLLIEGCDVDFFDDNITITSGSAGRNNLIVRHNVIRNSYSTDSHSQGLYVSSSSGQVDTVLIEKNIFDHNGWNEDVEGGEKTKFNHSMYITGGTSNVMVRKNISARASSHGLQLRVGSNRVAEDNLIVGNCIGILLASGAGTIQRNAIMESGDIGPEDVLGWGFETGGSTGAVFDDNIVAHTASTSSNTGIIIAATNTDTTVSNNIIYDWNGSLVNNGTNTTLTNNDVDEEGYVDPERTCATYNADVLMGAETLAAFVADAISNWGDVEYAAETVLTYIREGFEVA